MYHRVTSSPQRKEIYVHRKTCTQMFGSFMSKNPKLDIEKECESVSCSVVSNSLQPMDCSLPGSSIHGTLQIRTLVWVAIPLLWDHSNLGEGV